MRSYYLIMFLFPVLLISCSGSETYRGNWKATNSDGDHLNITFKEKSFAIVNDGTSKSYGYSQHSITISNSVKTYGIELDDGRKYQIRFPLTNDETKGIIYKENGNLSYTICRTKFINYEDIYRLE